MITTSNKEEEEEEEEEEETRKVQAWTSVRMIISQTGHPEKLRRKQVLQTFSHLLLNIKVRVGCWQDGCFAGFIFEPPDFFANFIAGLFSPPFYGKKCPEKSSKKSSGKILQNLYNKNPQHISAEGPGQ